MRSALRPAGSDAAFRAVDNDTNFRLYFDIAHGQMSLSPDETGLIPDAR
ncbi:hypothetical protein [Acetobacter nitrogenifigens]|nr:hypothetical protein [Acetobacter nitrogenifigens]